MAERHVFHINDAGHGESPAANPLQEQFISDQDNGKGNVRLPTIQDGSRADELIGKTPWANSRYLREVTKNGHLGCALLVGQALGLPGVTGVHELDRQLRARHYTELPEVTAQTFLPANAILIGTKGFKAGESHVGIMDRSGMVVDNAPNPVTGRWEGKKEPVQAFMDRHPGMRFYALLPKPGK